VFYRLNKNFIEKTKNTADNSVNLSLTINIFMPPKSVFLIKE